MNLFLAPHNDDETVFGSFLIMSQRPEVCIVFDSYVQPSRGFHGCDKDTRRKESMKAILELTYEQGKGHVQLHFFGLWDSRQYEVGAIAATLRQNYPAVDFIFAPADEPGGHEQHNLVAQAADLAFPGKVQHYLTYTREGGKSRSGIEVKPRSGKEIARKLRALACYHSQHDLDPRLGCAPWFLGDLKEYVVSQ